MLFMAAQVHYNIKNASSFFPVRVKEFLLESAAISIIQLLYRNIVIVQNFPIKCIGKAKSGKWPVHLKGNYECVIHVETS